MHGKDRKRTDCRPEMRDEFRQAICRVQRRFYSMSYSHMLHGAGIFIPSGVIKRGKLGNPLEIGVSIGTSPINSIFSVAMITRGYLHLG